MALTIRHYIFQDDGALKRVPRRIVDGLPFGTDAIPEYAGTKQRHAEVLVENEDRKPLRILDVIGTFWLFDDEGRIDRDLRRETNEWIDHVFSSMGREKPDGPIVDLVPEIKKRDLHKRHRWTITKDELDLIAADIWPGVHGPAPEIESVKGKAPKRPPLSHEAKTAIQEIGGKLEMIKFELRRLNEHALKGLEFEALRTASFENETLWCGVAAEAKLQREIRAAYRTGRGEWYAVIDAYQPEGPQIERSVASAHEKCRTRPEAIEVGRRMMAEKSDWLGPDTRIEVSIVSALEWLPDDGD